MLPRGFGTQDLLKSALADIEGIEAPHRRDIKVNVLGINHFTWLDKATYEGRDLFPVYRKFVEKYYESGFEKTAKGHWLNDFFSSANRVKFDLFKRYGIIAAAGDRHLAEFCPPWYLKDPDTASSWMFSLTPVSWRKTNLVERREKGNRLISGEETFELKLTGEDGILQMKAIVGLGDFVTNVNLPNYGQISNLPMGAVVETNAVFSRNNVRPVNAGALPDDVQSLVYRHVINQETTLKAALKKDKDLAFRAANDCDDSRFTRQLFIEMLQATKVYLPGWNLDQSARIQEKLPALVGNETFLWIFSVETRASDNIKARVFSVTELSRSVLTLACARAIEGRDHTHILNTLQNTTCRLSGASDGLQNL